MDAGRTPLMEVLSTLSLEDMERPPPMPSEPDRGAAVARKEEAVAVAAVEADATTSSARALAASCAAWLRVV